jgi:hypothetical protein
MFFLMRKSRGYCLASFIVMLTCMAIASNCPDGGEPTITNTSYFWYDASNQPDISGINWSSPVLSDATVAGTQLKLTYVKSRVIPVNQEKGAIYDYECPNDDGEYVVFSFAALDTRTITRTETDTTLETVSGSYETQTLVGDENADLGSWDQITSTVVTGVDWLGRAITVVTVLTFFL